MSSRKLTILVDVDDTIENLLDAWCEWLNREYNTSFMADKVTEWDLTQKFAPLTHEQIISPLSLPEFWDTVMPKPGAQAALIKMMDDGHEVYLVTASHYDTYKPKIEHMINRCFWFIDYDHIICTSNKKLIKGDLIIDDGAHNLGTTPGILFDAPHNRGVDAEDVNAIRLYTWEQIYDYVCQIAEAEPNSIFDPLFKEIYDMEHTVYSALTTFRNAVETFCDEKGGFD